MGGGGGGVGVAVGKGVLEDGGDEVQVGGFVDFGDYEGVEVGGAEDGFEAGWGEGGQLGFWRG